MKTHDLSTMTIPERIAVCELTKGRFSGRLALTRGAQLGDYLALLQLEQRLGLRSTDSCRAERYRYEFRSPDEVTALCRARRSGDVYDLRLEALRRARRERRDANVDKLATRAPLHWLRKVRARAHNRTICAWPFRAATHGHSVRVRFVPLDQVEVIALTEQVSPRSVGLPNAYSRKGYGVTVSSHEWRVALEFAPYYEGGYAYLSETRRVRQGRGTDLVVERLVQGARGLVWRAS